MSQEATMSKIIHRVGDVNPIEYGGGVIIDLGNGRVQAEVFPFGLEGMGIKAGDETEDTKLTVYRFDIEKDAAADLNWADYIDVAASIGMTPDEFMDLGCSDDVRQQYLYYEAVAEDCGWENLDQYPLQLTIAELKTRWEIK